MAASTSELIATTRSWFKCVNEKRWDDLPKYMHTTYNQNGQDYTPESWATYIKEHMAPEMGGEVRINEDSIMVDEKAQCVAFSTWSKFKPEKPFLGYQLMRREVLLVGHGFVWFTNGKLSKSLFMTNNDDMRKQLATLSTEYVPSLISEYPAPKSTAPLSREELHEIYNAYVDTVNCRRIETHFDKFYNRPEQTLNNKVHARGIVEDTLSAIPDLHVDIHTLVADEEKQRLAVWLDFTGTPVRDYAGLIANGRSVHFTEHATYQFVNGKIQRIWGVMDFDKAREQQKCAK
ncbi:SnoaL-domain-containing protein [Hypoxylon sp. NC1633]|nr:SnoaL-domain-containing protein [Hypoxylon sp. NC1633]